jgi:hypothetical protein
MLKPVTVLWRGPGEIEFAVGLSSPGLEKGCASRSLLPSDASSSVWGFGIGSNEGWAGVERGLTPVALGFTLVLGFVAPPARLVSPQVGSFAVRIVFTSPGSLKQLALSCADA